MDTMLYQRDIYFEARLLAERVNTDQFLSPLFLLITLVIVILVSI